MYYIVVYFTNKILFSLKIEFCERLEFGLVQYNSEAFLHGRYHRELLNIFPKFGQGQTTFHQIAFLTYRQQVFKGFISALDSSSQIRLKHFLSQLQEQRNITMLISSHDLNHITEVSSRIVVLEKGKIVKDIQKNENTLEELKTFFAVETINK